MHLVLNLFKWCKWRKKYSGPAASGVWVKQRNIRTAYL